MTRAPLILAAILLAGCNTVPTPVTPPLTAVCIPLGNVSPAEQKAAGDALRGVTPEQRAALTPIFLDWIGMRDADRACLNSR